MTRKILLALAFLGLAALPLEAQGQRTAHYTCDGGLRRHAR